MNVLPNSAVLALINELLVRGPKEAEWHPVDSRFVDAYRYRIAQCNAVDFIVGALHTNLPIFTIPLFLCLPELWKRVDGNALMALLDRMESGMVCFTYLEFVYKHLEVDLLEEALQPAGKHYDMASLNLLLTSSQVGCLFDREAALDDLLFGPEASYLRFNSTEWADVTRHLLRDPRLKPAVTGQQGAEHLATLIASY